MTDSNDTTYSGSPAAEANGGKDRASQRARRRKIYIALGVLALVAFLVYAFQPQPIPADFAGVERGTLEVTLDEEGETRVRERYVVSAPVAGRILRIELEPGDPVVADVTVLATFQPTAPTLLDSRSRAEGEARVRAARAARGQAKAELERARAELEFAEAELKRNLQLAEDEIVSRERLDSAELNLKTRQRAVDAAEFRVETTEHELEQVQATLRRTGSGTGDLEPMVMTSPVDGVVLSRRRESESVVPAGEPLLEVADPSQLEIVSDFLSTDAVQIDPGDPVYIEQWGGEGRLEGTVRRVEPSGFTKISALGVEEQRVNVIIDFADPQEAWEALGDGYRVEVRVVIWRGDDVLKVPTSALFRHADGWAVFAAPGDKAQLTPVEIGRRNGLNAEVKSGLSEGDRLVVHPSDEVEDGVAVEERIAG